MEDPLELLKQKFFNKELSKSEQLLFAEALELDEDFADTVAEELHRREMIFLETYKQMDAETLQKADFRIITSVNMPENSSDSPVILEPSASVATNMGSWYIVFKYAAAALLSSVVLFVGWKKWMPKTSISKKEGILMPSTVQQMPVAPIDSHSKSEQLPPIPAKPVLPQKLEKRTQNNASTTTEMPNLKIQTIENQSIIKESTVPMPIAEKPLINVEHASVAKEPLIQTRSFNIEMKPILEELHNPSAGKPVHKTTNWYEGYKALIHNKSVTETDLVEMQRLLMEAQKMFKDVQPNQLEEKEISPNQVFAFLMLNLSVLPLTEPQKQDLKLWWSYRNYNEQQKSILLRCEKMYEAMVAEK
jgi:hypothetical protein